MHSDRFPGRIAWLAALFLLAPPALAQELPPPVVSVQTMTPEALPIVNELPGRVAATRTAEVRPRVGGIVVSRVFDRANTPRYAIEYLLYHEMLHLKHPVHVRGGRRCVHSREFQAEEKLFPELEQARAYLTRL